MANYSSKDWNVYIYVPVAGSFILDQSQLDGPDTLASTTGSLEKQTNIRISEIVINNGSSVSQGIFLDTVPSTLSLTVEVLNATANVLSTYYSGREIQITLNNNFDVGGGTIFGNGTETLMFAGYITSTTMSYDPNSDIAILSVTAESHMQSYLNTLKAITRTVGGNKGLSILGYTKGSYSWGIADTTVKTVGEWLTDYNTCEMMVPKPPTLFTIAADPITGYWFVNFNAETSVDYSINTVGIATQTYTDADIVATNIEVASFDHPTNVSLTNASNSAQIVQLGDTDTSAINKFVYSGTVDVNGTTQMTTIANKMISMMPAIAPTTLTIQIAQNYGLSPFFASGIGGWQFQRLADIADTISISSTKLNISNKKMLVVGRTINVDRDNFNVTYNLWKGF